MNHIFGHKFAGTYGESAVDREGLLTDVAQTWATGLRGITGAQIAVALHRCIDRNDAWPPALPEFRSMCLPEKTKIYHRDVKAREDLGYVALPRRALTPEEIRQHMSEIRKRIATGERNNEPEKKE